MTYDVLIRHSVPVPGGDGFKHHFEYRTVDAGSEPEAFARTPIGAYEHIACIDAWHHRGVMPYSVDMGEPDFFAQVDRPAHQPGSEPRVG